MDIATQARCLTSDRASPGKCIFAAVGRETLSVRAGATIGDVAFREDTPVALPALVAGCDYYIGLDGANLVAIAADGLPGNGIVGGFHYAPGGNAPARAGGDAVPAINPLSCWGAGFRPACPDPRGMTFVDHDGLLFWCDIYKLGIDHLDQGTSRHGVVIADGSDLPQAVSGKGRTKKLDYATAVEIYAHHGKRLLSYDEFRVAAFGVMEKTAVSRDPVRTGLDAERTSRFGLMQATGNLWDWGTDGDPDRPRASLFGGCWWRGGDAGSRCAGLGAWAVFSYESFSARGACDHLSPA